uniref:Uncharacterized protein n=1 Tax=Amphimedon queenslandica TaxID=400682 RepID=A0A1X7SXY0_AMPQE
MASKNQLNVRVFHRTVSVGDSLYVWGGAQAGLPLVHDSEEKRRFTSNIQHFTPSTGQWITRGTTGTPPLGVDGYCCTAINDLLYYFGGRCSHDNCYHNSITQLDTVSLQWRELEPTDATRPVMRRESGGMISFEHDGVHHLLTIGGLGSKPAVQLPHYKYANGNWCTNEHSIYNISSRKWSNPSIIGQCIPPASHFIIEKINNTRAFWQCIKKPEAIDQWPVGRFAHAGAIIVTGSDCPMLVISGGMDKNKDTLDDCWIFNIIQHSWIKLAVPHSVSKRCGHSLSVFIMSPHCVWIITAGGAVHNGPVTNPNIAMVTELVLDSNGGCLVGDTYDSNLMTSEEYKKKYQQQLQTGRRIWLEEYQKPRKGDTANIEQTVQTLMKNLEAKQKELEESKKEAQ